MSSGEEVNLPGVPLRCRIFGHRLYSLSISHCARGCRAFEGAFGTYFWRKAK